MAVGREIWCNGQNHPLGHFTKSRPIETSLPCAGDMDANMGLPSLSEFEVWQTKEENIRAAYNELMEGLKERE